MKYSYFDTRCDTLTEIYKNKDSLASEKYAVNIRHLKKYYRSAQVFAIYNSGIFCKEDILSIIEYAKAEFANFSEFISLTEDSSAISSNLLSGKISALLAIESLGSQPDYSGDCIKLYFENGVRIMGLCHNDDNILCGGCGKNSSGLTILGRQSLRLMQSLGVILDVSHMSDISFWEACEEYCLPPVATHSNSRSICPDPRNLTDKQFVCLVKRGGICGINYYPPFLSGENVSIDNVVCHIEHFLSLGGENNICLGSDFDGIDKTACGLENAGKVCQLIDRLLSINYNESLVNKIAFNNFHNFMRKFETLI